MNNELKALRELFVQHRRLSMTPPVDDDFWEIKRDYDSAYKNSEEFINTFFDLEQHLIKQYMWSSNTFGLGCRTKGIIDHIIKETQEVLADPNDAKEWIDIIILAFDGAMRAGLQPFEIINGIVEKQSINEGRQWPDWETAEPNKAIEHIRD